MKHCALQTVSSKSRSIPNKNMTYTRDGFQLYRYNLDAAYYSNIYNDGIYVISDYDESFMEYVRVIKEDTTKYKSTGNHHYECILQGLDAIEKEQGKLDYLTILLGNSRGASALALQQAFAMLQTCSQYDSCMSVSKFNMFNPYRAFKCENGDIKNWINPETIKQHNTDLNDKIAFDDTYFFNGSFWIVKRDVLVANNGLPPFTWMGNKILAFFQEDGIMELDAPWQLSNII